MNQSIKWPPNGRLWNKGVKDWGYMIRITLIKHFQLISFDEES